MADRGSFSPFPSLFAFDSPWQGVEMTTIQSSAIDSRCWMSCIFTFVISSGHIPALGPWWRSIIMLLVLFMSRYSALGLWRPRNLKGLVSLAGDPHPWNAFWRNNVAELQRALKITHHPVTIELNWNACKRSHLFHLIVPVYRAFHRLGIRLHCKPSAILAQTPHRNCNFKLDNGKSLPTPRGNRLANKVVRAQI